MNASSPQGTRHRGLAIDSPPYQRFDLVSRRKALGLSQEDLASALGIDLANYRRRENGDRTIGPHLVNELMLMGSFVTATATQMTQSTPADGLVVIPAAGDHEAFEREYPQARTSRESAAYPMTLQHVAAGRAAAELSRQGRQVEVHRDGGRRADFLVRRLAVGLVERSVAVRLFGVNKDSYGAAEAGKKSPGGSVLAEYQALDDFILATAANVEVVERAGVTAVITFADQHQFERAYPHARSGKTNAPYPVAVHQVAAARRAQILESSGHQVRIIVR